MALMWWPWKKKALPPTGQPMELPHLSGNEDSYAPARWVEEPSARDKARREFVLAEMDRFSSGQYSRTIATTERVTKVKAAPGKVEQSPGNVKDPMTTAPVYVSIFKIGDDTFELMPTKNKETLPVADQVTELDAMRGPALDVKCTGCGKGLAYTKFLFEDNLRAGNSVTIRTLGGRPPLLWFQENETWDGNVCTSCGSVWCPACRSPTGEVGPTPCPQCGLPTSPAFREHIEAIQREAPFVIGTAIFFVENSNDGNLGLQILRALQPRSY